MKHIAVVLVIFLVLPLSGFAANLTTPVSSPIEESFSFENDFEGWAIPRDSELVTRSQERAFTGVTSLKLVCPAAFQTVLIERPFSVEANQVYDVEVDYALASRVGRDSLSTTIPTSFGLLTGASSQSVAQNFGQVFRAIQGSADNGENTSGNYQWLAKQFTFTARADVQGMIYIIIGMSSSEGSSVFYLDNVQARIIKRPEPCEFFSFENDLEGWTANATDTGSQGTAASWSITPGSTAAQFTIDNLSGNAKVWIEKSFPVEPKTPYRVIVEYGFLESLLAPKSRIITGVLNKPPQTADDLQPAFQEKAGDPGYPLKRKRYEFDVKSKKSGMLTIVLGIFAAKKTHQLYYFENVCITLIKQ